MVRTAKELAQESDRAETGQKPAVVSGYAIAAEYDAESGRLVVHFPKITEEERAFRKELMARTLAHRDQQPPLGITSAELIREARAEAHGDDDARVFPGGGRF
ncbi:MAG: hypothetical protein ACR2JW_08970 [Thermomicrobiales bacterium]